MGSPCSTEDSASKAVSAAWGAHFTSPTLLAPNPVERSTFYPADSQTCHGNFVKVARKLPAFRTEVTEVPSLLLGKKLNLKLISTFLYLLLFQFWIIMGRQATAATKIIVLRYPVVISSRLGRHLSGCHDGTG